MAGHDPEVVKVRGLGIGPRFMHVMTAGRKEVEQLTGQRSGAGAGHRRRRGDLGLAAGSSSGRRPTRSTAPRWPAPDQPRSSDIPGSIVARSQMFRSCLHTSSECCSVPRHRQPVSRIPARHRAGSGETNEWGEPTSGGGAGSFSASPTANPVGRRRRLVLAYLRKAPPRHTRSSRPRWRWSPWPRSRRCRWGSPRPAPAAPAARRSQAPRRQGQARPRQGDRAVRRAQARGPRDRCREQDRQAQALLLWRRPCELQVELLRLLGLGQLRAARRPAAQRGRWTPAGWRAGVTGASGKWITVYANAGHAYMKVAGLRFDTSMTAGEGPGWSKHMRSGRGYTKRHKSRF